MLSPREWTFIGADLHQLQSEGAGALPGPPGCCLSTLQALFRGCCPLTKRLPKGKNWPRPAILPAISSIRAKQGFSRRVRWHETGCQLLDRQAWGLWPQPSVDQLPHPHMDQLPPPPTPRKLQINFQRKKNVLLFNFHSKRERTVTEKSDTRHDMLITSEVQLCQVPGSISPGDIVLFFSPPVWAITCKSLHPKHPGRGSV